MLIGKQNQENKCLTCNDWKGIIMVLLSIIIKKALVKKIGDLQCFIENIASQKVIKK